MADGRILRNIRHGDDVTDRRPENERRLDPEGVPVVDELAEVSTPFGYLFDAITTDPGSHLPDTAGVVAALRALGSAMVDPDTTPPDTFNADGNSTIPPVFTYLGQFIDHDITANTDRNNEVSDVTAAALSPVDPAVVVDKLRNLRVPALDLDSVYGDGPTLDATDATDAADLYDGIRLRVGDVNLVSDNPGFPITGQRIPLEGDLARDLPREADGTALIADARNDENLIVAQLHVAFLRFHNAAIDWVRANETSYADDRAVFERARQLTRWHYQWLVVHEFLPMIALPGVVDDVLLHGNRHFFERDGEVFMPLEFSIAAYRFGHTMVRGVYDFNRNFGRPGDNRPAAPFNLLFAFTGRGGFLGQGKRLPFNWIVEWDRFVERHPRFPDHFARRLDTRLVPPLSTMANELQGLSAAQAADVDVVNIMQSLAIRNLLRGYLLSLPTGQAVAGQLGLTPLTSAELQQGNTDAVNSALSAGGFVERTPLWFYVLKEAEVRAGGNSLGELGSRIVAETLIGLVRFDDGSFLSGPQPQPWRPADGVRLPDGAPVTGIKDFFRFAGVAPTRP